MLLQVQTGQEGKILVSSLVRLCDLVSLFTQFFKKSLHNLHHGNVT